MIDEFEVPSPQRLVFPALAPLYRRLAPWSYAAARILMGLVVLPAGIDKVFMGGVARIAVGNIVKAGFYPPFFWVGTGDVTQ